MPLKPGEVRRELRRKFEFQDVGGTNHDRFELWLDGVYLAYVDVDRTTTDLGDDLIKFMAHQAGVKTRQFKEMIRCTISRAQYLAILVPPTVPPLAIDET